MKSLLLFILLVCSVIAGAIYYLPDNLGGFPVLEPGSYWGELKIDESGKNYEFFADVDREHDLYIQLSDVHQVHLIGKVDFESEKLNSLLRFKLFNKLLELSGSCTQAECRGNIEKDGNLTGTWTLVKANNQQVVPNDLVVEQLIKAAQLREQKIELQEQLAKLSLEVKNLTDEYNQYDQLITAGTEAKELSERKYDELSAQVREAELLVRSKKDALVESQEKLQVALRQTPLGKLVNLARESLDLENKITEIKAKQSEINSSQLQEKLAAAERILDLKRQILEERDRIFELSRRW